MYTRYYLSNRPPNLQQLNPFTDISNPLNIITGNPELQPSNEHQLYVGFNNFNFQKGTGSYAYFSTNMTNNQVVAKSVIDENLVRTTTYENVNGNFNVSGSISYSKEIKLDSIKKVRLRLSMWTNIRRAVNFFNGDQVCLFKYLL